MELKVVLDKEGNARHLVDENNNEFYEVFGPVEAIQRSSHVEPTYELSNEAVLFLFGEGSLVDYQIPFDVERRILLLPEHTHAHELRKLLPKNVWWADMFPCGRREVLGPFNTRQEALQAEVDWLVKNHLPVPTA